MKRKVIVSLLAIAMLLVSLGALIVGCNDVQKEEYSVTVLSPADAPLAGITVNWSIGSSVKGSAVTDETGKRR